MFFQYATPPLPILMPLSPRAQILSLAVTAAVVILGFTMASSLQAVGNFATAVMIVAVDAVLPFVVRAASSLERHHNSVGHEFSVMNKVCLLMFGVLCGVVWCCVV